MNDLILYAILAFMGIAIVYLIAKIRQPIELAPKDKAKADKDNFIEDIGSIGDILTELEPEIVKGLNLKEEQAKSLKHWIITIDKITKSKVLKWVAKRVMK